MFVTAEIEVASDEVLQLHEINNETFLIRYSESISSSSLDFASEFLTSRSSASARSCFALYLFESVKKGDKE